jgi:hypothetical protein
MPEFFKAVTPDLTDFFPVRVSYKIGATITHPDPAEAPELYKPGLLHATSDPSAALVGGSWPCRLLIVEGEPLVSGSYMHGFVELEVLREVEAHRALGPNGEDVAGLIERARRMTADELQRLALAASAARDAARDADREAASYAATYAAGLAVGWAGNYVIEHTVLAALVRDLIPREDYNILCRPWRDVIGPPHERVAQLMADHRAAADSGIDETRADPVAT